MWTILSKQIDKEAKKSEVLSPMEEAKRVMEYKLRVEEDRDLGRDRNPNEVFHEVFGYSRNLEDEIYTEKYWHYPDA